MVGLAGVPRAVVTAFLTERMTKFLCMAMGSLYVYGDVATSTAMSGIAIARFNVARKADNLIVPLRHTWLSRITAAASVLDGLLVSGLLFLKVKDGPVVTCHLAALWPHDSLLLTFGLSMIFSFVISVLNIVISIIIWWKSNSAPSLNNVRTTLALKALGIILVYFVCNTLPKFALFWVMIQNPMDEEAFIATQIVLGFCEQFSSVLSPLVYCFTHEKVAVELKNIFCVKKPEVKNIIPLNPVGSAIPKSPQPTMRSVLGTPRTPAIGPKQPKTASELCLVSEL
ncbi:hypothetical protein L596_015932 [Steinernema carpocapsae]|uniref:G-protein coupled receptors family 1 profile domain-containing protein n=1 Tax=Steinernema carpocapsae TaxID=34508 RepID=A0A4U5NGH6_STECR|nr:hypothetical protein L596_015932 [Steinernema carpocapsae]